MSRETRLQFVFVAAAVIEMILVGGGLLLLASRLTCPLVVIPVLVLAGWLIGRINVVRMRRYLEGSSK